MVGIRVRYLSIVLANTGRRKERSPAIPCEGSALSLCVLTPKSILRKRASQSTDISSQVASSAFTIDPSKGKPGSLTPSFSSFHTSEQSSSPAVLVDRCYSAPFAYTMRGQTEARARGRLKVQTDGSEVRPVNPRSASASHGFALTKVVRSSSSVTSGSAHRARGGFSGQIRV